MEVNMGNIRETFFANQLFKPNEVFVFGSNLAGMHGGGAARIARMYFGAVILECYFRFSFVYCCYNNN